MTEISMNTAVLFAQMESVYNTSPGAMSATDAVLIKNLTAVPLTGTRVERELVRPYFGANPGKLAAQHGTMQFTAEAAGAGVTALDAGTAPAFGKLLRMAGLDETLRAAAATIAASPPTEVDTPDGSFTYVAADPYTGTVDRLVTLTCTTGGGSGVAAFTVAAPAVAHIAAYNATGVVMTDATPFALPGSATITPTVGDAFTIGDEFTIQLRAPAAIYTPLSTGFESGETFFQYGPNKHPLLGVRGNVTLNAAADAYFDMQFDMMGLPGTFTGNEALPTVDFSAFQDPLLLSNDDSPYVALGGFECNLRSFNVNVGQNTAIRSLVGSKKARIGGRSASGSIVLEAPDLDTKDYFASLASGAYNTFELIHGTARGATVHLTARLQLTGVRYQDEDGVAMLAADIVAVPSDAGNDELTLAIR